MADATARNGFFERGGAWVLIQFVLIAAVIIPSILFHGVEMWPGIHAVGIVLLLAGGVFGISGVMILGRNSTPLPHPRDGSQLVQSGIYSVVRHPLYTSVMLASLGWALTWKSWFALPPALMLIPFFRAKVRREERWLLEKFPDYADYSRRIPRFIPNFRRPSKLN